MTLYQILVQIGQKLSESVKGKRSSSSTDLLASEESHSDELVPKRWKAASLGTDDRISELPDLIIGEILSLLPTKQAVATSILSKRWRYHWTSVRSLDFHCSDERKEANFVEFVDRVLSKCTTHDLHKFYLSANWCHSHADRWINEAVIRNVQRLKLNVPKLPGSVFTCGSLTSLECYGLQKLLNIPDSFYLPKLKILHVSFNRESTSIAQKLISSCPVLEDLSLGVVDIQLTFVISPPILKKLILKTIDTERKIVIDAPQLQFLYIESNCFIEKGSKFVIDAPQLEYLDIDSLGHVPSYVIKNVGSEVEATISVLGHCNRDVTDKETSSILELLTQLSGAKSLALDTSYLIGPGNADPNILPIFNKMTLLTLEMGSFYGLEIISHLIQASPSLKVFIIKMVDSYDDAEEPPFEVFEFEWIEPQHVPKCLSSCLQVVELHCNFQEEIKQELEMVKYLLGHGEVLQKLVFSNQVVYKCEEVYKKLLTFPRASRHCEVQVL